LQGVTDAILLFEILMVPGNIVPEITLTIWPERENEFCISFFCKCDLKTKVMISNFTVFVSMKLS
jgi:hypothetical protein